MTTLDFSQQQRQWAFIEALRDRYAGAAARYYIKTYGCQMNEHDSEALAGMLNEMGLSPTDEVEEAQVVVINTCCVREHAEVKVHGNVGALRFLKEANPELMICVCGCMMQQEPVARALAAKYPFIDLIFGTHRVHCFPELLARATQSAHTVMDIADSEGVIVEHMPAARVEGCTAWVTIMYGCDNYCAYCIVPYVRGRERSRDSAEILSEIRQLVDQGVKEVTLLGQNVNSYGRTLEKPVTFAGLLKQIHAIEGLERIRFMTSHPKDLSDELIEAFGSLPKLCHHLHLPVQSGDDEILRRMNRRYSAAQYLELVGRLRAACPDIALTTDLIVGFPGETREQFEHTLELVRQAGYDGAFSFKYSPRQGTPAAMMAGQVPDEEKKARLAELNRVLEQTGQPLHEAYLGREVEVLVERVNDRRPDQLTGKTSTAKTVNFAGPAQWVGQLVKVKITKIKAHTLFGEAVDERKG